MLVCTISPDRPFVGLELVGANHGLSFRFDHLAEFEYLREFEMDFRLYPKVGTRYVFLSPLPLVRYLEIVLPLRAGPLFSKIC